MSWFWITLIAQFIFATSAVFDKLLLKRKFFDPWAYTFWFGILGICSVFLLPFGFSRLPFNTAILALFTGIIFDLSALFLYLALDKSEASKIFPFAGGMAPFFTLFFSYIFIGSGLGVGEIIGFFLLVVGGILFYFLEEKENRAKVIFLALASALTFGLSSILTKIVFNHSTFISGFLWIKIGGFLFALSFLLRPKIREKILAGNRDSGASNKLWYFANRAYAAIASIMVYFAVKLAHPALVDSMQSLRYVIIFFVAWFLLKEKFYGKILVEKIIATILIVAGVFFIGISDYARNPPIDINRKIEWGVTFSTKASRDFGLDWQQNFLAIINELKPKKIRLIAYWDEIEKTQGTFDFTDLDWQVEKVSKASSYAKVGTGIVLALGMKTPRWPECHEPEWVRNQNVNIKNQNYLLSYITKVVEHYRENPNIEMWQVENEPFLKFGECPERPEGFLQEEIKLVKSLDQNRPILTTDGGEFGRWLWAAKEGDVFGTTMYRKVYMGNLIGKLFGVIEYPLSPNFFRLKEKIVRMFLSDEKKNEKFIVIELQAEPWGIGAVKYISYDEQMKLMSPEYFSGIMEYAKQTGFNEYYLWGAEWWYWMKTTHNDPRFWEIVKTLIKNE